MHRTRSTAATLAVVLLTTFTACGGDTDPATGAEPTSASPVSGEPSPADTTAGTGADSGTDDDMGYCRVDITGDVSTSFTGPGGAAAVGYGPWFGAAFPDQTVGIDESVFLLNCLGEGSTGVNIILRQGYTVPMQPASYPIVASVNQLGMSDEGPITMLVSIDGSDTNWGAAADGTLVITEFDGEHIAGNFTLPIRDVLLADGIDSGTATVTGEFDLRNPN